MMHSRRSSPAAPDRSPLRLSGNVAGKVSGGKVVTSFLQPLLVDLIALVLYGKQAQWHLHGRHVPLIREPLERLIADTRVRSDDVALRMVVFGACVDVRPATVATTTGLPDFPPGFVGEDKTMGALIDQIDAAIARARNALGPLGAIDPVSQTIVLGVLRSLERSRWEFAAQVPAEPTPLPAEEPPDSPPPTSGLQGPCPRE